MKGFLLNEQKIRTQQKHPHKARSTDKIWAKELKN